MTSTIRHRLLASAFVMVAAAMGFSAGPALAQKQGGTLTVGLELDIPGFDPLKVGVYDTSATIAASLILEQLTSLGDDGKAKPSSLCRGPVPTTSRPGPSSSGPT